MGSRIRREVEFGEDSRVFQFEDGRVFVVRYTGDERREVKAEKELIVALMDEIEGLHE